VGQRAVCRLTRNNYREHWHPKGRFWLPKTALQLNCRDLETASVWVITLRILALAHGTACLEFQLASIDLFNRFIAVSTINKSAALPSHFFAGIVIAAPIDRKAI
jgi:hypothetical protein